MHLSHIRQHLTNYTVVLLMPITWFFQLICCREIWANFISKHNKIHTYQKIKWTWPVWWQFYIFFTSEGNSWLEGWNVLAIFGSYNVLLCKTRPLRYILNLWTFFLFDYILQSHHTYHSQQTFFLSPKSFRLQLDLIINEMKSSINQDPFL